MTPDLLLVPPTVTLVGAGPGDPGLLTIAAARAIASASLLLIDDLVDEAVLCHARPDARIVRVGKRGGCRSTPQDFICRLMVIGARAGETVVRLKGGDPFVFGRGGEEVEHLRAAGLRVETINGITSGLAAATSIGVPLTHRDHAHGVAFVTGHQRPGDEAPDWAALAATAKLARLTLVIYMGVGSAEAIQEGLLRGLPAATPVAVVQNASRPDQRQALCTLGGLAGTLHAERLDSPSIIIVGDVVRGADAARGVEAASPAAGSAPRAALA